MLIVLKKGWKRLSRSQTAKLLALEFLVVLGGVLAAQLLQGWFAERAERRAAEAQFEGISQALHNSAELAIIRPRMNLCMLDAIERVRDVLADPALDRSSLDWLGPPEQMVLDETGIDAARPLLTRHFDSDWMMRLSSAEFMNAYMREGQDDELEAWTNLAVLRPENGAIDQTLRGELRLALAKASRANQVLRDVSTIMSRQAEALDVPIHQNTVEGVARSPKLCMNMVGYDAEAHQEAYARGQLPDGRTLHPRLLPREQNATGQ